MTMRARIIARLLACLASVAAMAPRAVDRMTFGAGCFWAPQAAFARVPGVVSATVGYAGGARARPTYASVCAGDGHTEVVDVVYDGARSTNGSYESCRVLPNAQDPRVRVLRVHGLAPDPWVRVVRVRRVPGPTGPNLGSK